MADRDHLLCRSIACRYDFADQSVRGSDCYSAGEVKAWKSSGMCTYGDRGSGRVLLIQGIVSDWMDVLSIYICPLGAGLAGIMFFWVCGKAFVEKQVNTGREKPYVSWYHTVCKYFYVPVCFIVLILGIVLGGIG